MEKLKDMDCERTLEFVLWKLCEIKSIDKMRDFVKKWLSTVHEENMSELEQYIG